MVSSKLHVGNREDKYFINAPRHSVSDSLVVIQMYAASPTFPIQRCSLTKRCIVHSVRTDRYMAVILLTRSLLLRQSSSALTHSTWADLFPIPPGFTPSVVSGGNPSKVFLLKSILSAGPKDLSHERERIHIERWMVPRLNTLHWKRYECPGFYAIYALTQRCGTKKKDSCVVHALSQLLQTKF